MGLFSIILSFHKNLETSFGLREAEGFGVVVKVGIATAAAAPARPRWHNAPSSL